MNSLVPHYRLFSMADSENRPGYWRFCFQSEDGTIHFDTEDLEPEVRGARLELLTLVRALEALDEPATVTVATGSRFIREGLRHGISEWKQNHWQWERFGRMIPVRNADLWQRIDRALAIHHVSCAVRSTTPGLRPDRFGAPDYSEAGSGEAEHPALRERSSLTVQTPDVAQISGHVRKARRAGRLLVPFWRWSAALVGFARRLAIHRWWSVPRLPSAPVRLPWQSEMNQLVPK